MANGKTTLSVRADEETAEQFDRIAEESKLTKTDLFPLKIPPKIIQRAAASRIYALSNTLSDFIL